MPVSAGPTGSEDADAPFPGQDVPAGSNGTAAPGRPQPDSRANRETDSGAPGVPCRAAPCGCRALHQARSRAARAGRYGAGSGAGGARGAAGGGRLRPGRPRHSVLTFCGAAGVCPSCRPPRAASAAACEPAGPILPRGEQPKLVLGWPRSPRLPPPASRRGTFA